MNSDDLLIRPSSPEPIYRQIMEQLRRLIASEQMRPGQELPSVREVAAHHAINPMTVSRAYGLLESEGWIARRRGKGMVVAASRRRTQTDNRRLEHLDPWLQDLARMAHELDLPEPLVLDRLKYHLEASPRAARRADTRG